MQILRLQRRIDFPRCFKSFLCCLFYNYLPVRKIICRDTLSPPQLTGYAPVVGVFHPVTVGIAVFVRYELDISGFHAVKSHGRQFIHLKEPLSGKLRLDNGICALRIAYRRGIFFRLYEISGLLKQFHDFLAGDESVFAYKNLCFFVEPAVVVNNLSDRKIVSETYLIVIYIVSRSHFEASCTEIHLHITVLNYRYLLVDERNENLFPAKVVIPLVSRVDAYCSIGHDGLRTRGGYDKILIRRISLSVRYIVTKMIEMTLGVLVYDLIVTDSGKRFRIPVDHTDALVYHSILIEIAECGYHGIRKLRLHGKPGTVPVA